MNELVLLPFHKTFISNSGAQNRPERNHLYAGMDSRGCLYRMLLQFDTGMLPKNSDIISALVKACAAVPNQNANGFFTPYPVESAWNKRTAWETQPGTDTHIPGNTVEIDRNGWHIWDITNIVQAWVQKRMNNNGLMIKSMEAEPDLTCFEVQLSHNPNCCSPALYVKYDNECSSSFMHRRNKNTFEICRIGNEPAYSTWQNTAPFKMYTYFIQNMGPDEARVHVQISPNQSTHINEVAVWELALGETAAIVPEKYAFFTRLALRACSPEGRCKLKIWFQAQG
ncbi:MAG: DNRLRE domain-containing protein [Bacillota bacterium]